MTVPILVRRSKADHGPSRGLMVLGVLLVACKSTIMVDSFTLWKSSSRRSSPFLSLAGWSLPLHPKKVDRLSTTATTTTLWAASQEGSFDGSSSNNTPKRSVYDLQIFLNQCSVQSFLCVLNNMRDLQTLYWVDNFTQAALHRDDEHCNLQDEEEDDDDDEDVTQKLAESSMANVYQGPKSLLMEYHGLNAMDTTIFPTWDSYFAKLLETPDEFYIVESSSPYVKDYEMEINPASLCTRLLSVREQIAQEFAHDLGVVAKMGDGILERFEKARKNQNNNKNDRDNRKDDDDDGTGLSSTSSFSSATRSMMKMGGDNHLPTRKMESENLDFLGFPPSGSDNRGPSPLRKGNYDLLILLTTQESVLRMISENYSSSYEETEDKLSSFSYEEGCRREYLREFYQQRYHSHFEGNVDYGKAEMFLEDLLFSPPRSMMSIRGECCEVDPVEVAKDLLDYRAKVALQWQEECRRVPEEGHLDVRRRQLDRLMGITKVDSPQQPQQESESSPRLSLEEFLKSGSATGGVTKKQEPNPPKSSELPPPSSTSPTVKDTMGTNKQDQENQDGKKDNVTMDDKGSRARKTSDQQEEDKKKDQEDVTAQLGKTEKKERKDKTFKQQEERVVPSSAAADNLQALEDIFRAEVSSSSVSDQEKGFQQGQTMGSNVLIEEEEGVIISATENQERQQQEQQQDETTTLLQDIEDGTLSLDMLLFSKDGSSSHSESAEQQQKQQEDLNELFGQVLESLDLDKTSKAMKELQLKNTTEV